MNVNLIDFLKLFNGEIQYRVPMWQRRYRWDKETILQLVKDLEAIANAEGDKSHFGGTLITKQEPKSAGTSHDTYIVVDGQQRLTTISILLSCIASKLEKNGNTQNWTPQKIKVYLKNRMKPFSKLRLEPLDDKEYENILEGRSDGGYGMIAEAWKILGEETASIDVDLLMKGLGRFKVISFSCSNSDDPQQIFESLNTSGVPLTEGEKVKNWLLMGLDPKDQGMLYKYWLEVEDCLGAEWDPERVDEFLRDFLRWKTGETAAIRHSYANLRRWWYKSGGRDDRTELCKDFTRLAKLYGIIIGTKGQYHNNKIDEQLQFLRGLGIDVHRPFTLRLLDDASCPDATGAHEKELLAVLKAVSTWITRLWLADISTGGLNAEFARMAKLEFNTETESYSDYWIKEIQKLKRSRIAVPNAEEVEEGILKRKAYGGKASGTSKTILAAINSRLGNQAAPPIEDLSLEHIMPQELSDEWKKYLGEDLEECQNRYINSLANLTLVGKNYNPIISNRIYSEKRELYLKSSVTMTRELAKKYENWRKEDMDSRAKELAQSVDKWWPWENISRAKARWRIGGGEWREEKSFNGLLLNVIGVLLDKDPYENAERLKGEGSPKDIFVDGTEPITSGFRLKPIPGHEDYVVNVNLQGTALIQRAMEMAKRCGEVVDIEVPIYDSEDGTQTWKRVEIKSTRSRKQSGSSRQSKHRWRVNESEWKEENSFGDVLANVIAALLDMDPSGNAKRLLGDRKSKDLVRTGTKEFRRPRQIPGHEDYEVNVYLTGDTIIQLCMEMGRKCGVVVEIQRDVDTD